jgi:hypothetical protein
VLRWAHAASRAASIASASSLGVPLWNESCRTARLIRCRLNSEEPITMSSTAGRATVPVTHEPGPLAANASDPGGSGISIREMREPPSHALRCHPSGPCRCPRANPPCLAIRARRRPPSPAAAASKLWAAQHSENMSMSIAIAIASGGLRSQPGLDSWAE